MIIDLCCYANAIFQIANSKQKQINYYQQIKKINLLNQQNKDFFKILVSYFISKQEKKDLLKDILTKMQIDLDVIYWIWTIIDANQYNNFNLIFQKCTDLYCHIFNILKVTIISANKLTIDQLQKIKTFFAKNLKQQINLESEIDKSIIGGIKIKINNKTYDNSFVTKINELKQQLLINKG